MGAKTFLFLIIELTFASFLVHGLNIYSIVNGAPCVRLLNGTGTVGCQSRALYGPLFLVDSADVMQGFMQNSSYSSLSYVVVLSGNLFSRENILALRASGRVAGFLIDATERPTGVSPDSPCPNCQFDLYSNDPNRHIWNPTGSGMVFDNYDFSMFMLTNDTRINVTEAAQANRAKGNSELPLYGVQLDAYMWGITDSTTCLRRGTCDPVGSRSVWTALPQIPAGTTKPIILLSTTTDSTSMFHDLTVGRSATTSGVVALLAAFAALAKVDSSEFQKHLLFTFFDAESWDYSGSKRFVRDIVNFTCTIPVADGCQQPFQQNLNFTKIQLSNIESIIELTQVSGFEPVEGGVLYAHVDDPTISQSLVDRLIQVANETIGSAYSTPFLQPAYSAEQNYKLPPSSAMSFLQASRNIPTVVLGDYKSQFSNPFYHSDFDDSTNFNPARPDVTCQTAQVLANTAYLLANPGATSSPVTVNCSLVDELYYCLTLNFSCPLASLYFTLTGTGQPSHYSGVFYFGKVTAMSQFIQSFTSDLSATDVAGSCGTQSCDSVYTCVNGRCIILNAQLHDAYSLGIEFNYGLSQFLVVDGNQPLWTESQWQYTQAELFLIEPFGPQLGTLIAGIVITILSVVLTIFIQRYLKKTLKVE